MPDICLLHTNREYADSLAATVQSLHTDYEVEVISRVPVMDRVEQLITGGFDLIQTDELLVNGVLSTAMRGICNTPYVAVLRGWADYTNAHGQYGAIKNFTIKRRAKLALNYASEVIFLSDITMREIEKVYDHSGHIIGRPIDVDLYSSGIDENTDTFDILTVTNLRYKEKFRGVKTIVQGLGPILERDDSIRYRIAGGGKYLEDLRLFVEECPCRNQIEVLGFHEAIEDIYSSADLFVYVSFLDAYPTVVLEAQAAGLPIIGGDEVGVPEVIGDSGLVVSPSPEGITEAVERVLTDSELYADLQTKSRERMRTYNEDVTRKHIEVWDKVLNRTDASRGD